PRASSSSNAVCDRGRLADPKGPPTFTGPQTLVSRGPVSGGRRAAWAHVRGRHTSSPTNRLNSHRHAVDPSSTTSGYRLLVGCWNRSRFVSVFGMAHRDAADAAVAD